MEGLQRSGISFRRQGSSGLVWDDKLIQELNQAAAADAEKDGVVVQDHHHHHHHKPDLRRTKSDGGGATRAYKPVKVQQAEDPPSPRLSGCGFCSVFGKPAAHNNKNNNNNKSAKPKHR